MLPMNHPIRLTCKHCASEEITRDASAIWDVHSHSWVLSAVQDQMACEDCGQENMILEAPVLSE
jgi:ribosomal protein L37AE/L43A